MAQARVQWEAKQRRLNRFQPPRVTANAHWERYDVECKPAGVLELAEWGDRKSPIDFIIRMPYGVRGNQ